MPGHFSFLDVVMHILRSDYGRSSLRLKQIKILAFSAGHKCLHISQVSPLTLALTSHDTWADDGCAYHAARASQHNISFPGELSYSISYSHCKLATSAAWRGAWPLVRLHSAIYTSLSTAFSGFRRFASCRVRQYRSRRRHVDA